MQRLLRWAVPLVGTLVLLVVLAGCAPRSDGSLTPVTWFDRYDADVDIWWRPWSPHAIAPDIPTHEIAEDCNDNGIDDRYDRIGYIPRGPYGTGEGPTLMAAATARTAGRGRKEVVVFNENPTTPGVDVFRSDWTHKLNRLASLRETIAANASDLHLVDLDSDGLRDVLISHFQPIPPPEGSGDEPRRYLSRARRRTADLEAPDAFSIETLPLVEGDGDLRNTPVHSLEVLESGPAQVIATSGYTLSEEGFRLIPRNTAITHFRDRDLADPAQYPYNDEPHYIHASVVADFNGDGSSDYCAATSRGTLPEEHQLLCFPGPIDDTLIDRMGGDDKYRYEDLLPSSMPSDSHAQMIAADFAREAGDRVAAPDLIIPTNEGVAILHNRNLGDFGYCPAMSFEDGYCTDLVNRMFEDPLTIPLGGALRQVASADLDGDGDNDLVATLPERDQVVLLWNRLGSFFYSDGTSPRMTQLPVGDHPWGVIADDIDNDGRIEIVVSHSGDDTLWVLHQRERPVLMPAECSPRLGVFRLPPPPTD